MEKISIEDLKKLDQAGRATLLDSIPDEGDIFTTAEVPVFNPDESPEIVSEWALDRVVETILSNNTKK